MYRLGKMTNLNESNLGKIVSGKTKDPRISYVKAIADALEVSIDEIVIRHKIYPFPLLPSKTFLFLQYSEYRPLDTVSAPL